MQTTAAEAATVQGMMDDLYRNSRTLAQKANGTDTPTDEQVERAWYVLLAALLEREDTAPKMARALVIAATS